VLASETEKEACHTDLATVEALIGRQSAHAILARETRGEFGRPGTRSPLTAILHDSRSAASSSLRSALRFSLIFPREWMGERKLALTIADRRRRVNTRLMVRCDRAP
jgi:hypothetical protein